MANFAQHVWLATPLLLAALTSAASAARFFDGVNGAAYDFLVRARWDHDPPQVLLVEVEEGQGKLSDTELAVAVQKLRVLGAKVIAFAFLPEAGAPSFYLEAAAAEDVVLPAQFRVDGDALGEARIVWAAEPVAHESLKRGVVEMPPVRGGVARWHRVKYEVGGVFFRSLVAQVAVVALGDRELPVHDQFLVSFRGGPGSLPNVRLSRVLCGDLIEEMVKGKLVLVGRPRGSSEPGLATPTTRGQPTMSLLEYQGHALETLVSGNVVTEARDRWKFAWIAASTALTAWACRRASLQAVPWVVGSSVLVAGGVTVCLFASAGVWLPPAEAAASQGAFLVIALRGAALDVTASVRRLVADLSLRLRDQCWPAISASAPTSWSLVANMVNQTLDLTRLIFLDADPSKKRVREILGLNCSFQDIGENRRDLTRPPYRDAIEAKAPAAVEGYFKLADPGELQYLIPLQFRGEILGFWALGIDKDKAGAIPDFEVLLKDYASRMGELLYQGRRSGGGSRDSGSAVAQRDRTYGGADDQALPALKGLVRILEERLVSLDSLVNGLGSGVVVFDLFGRILHINELMLSLLKKEGLAPFEMTALELIMALSDYDISRARKLLRRVIVQSSAVSFPVALRSAPSSRYVVSLKPVAVAQRTGRGAQPEESSTRIVLCELSETTSAALLSEMKTRLTQRLCLQLRNDLTPIALSGWILQQKELEPQMRQRMVEAIQNAVQRAVRRLAECQGFLDAHADIDELDHFPVDPKPGLSSALEEAKAAVPTAVSFRIEQPNFVSYVFASSGKLTEFFRAVLRYLCQDAAEPSTVLVRVSEGEDVVTFDFSNMGFGIPDEVLQGYVHGDEPIDSVELQTIRDSAKWIASWGGTLEAFSGVGVGIHFTAHLVKYL